MIGKNGTGDFCILYEIGGADGVALLELEWSREKNVENELCMQIKTSHRNLRGCLKFINGAQLCVCMSLCLYFVVYTLRCCCAKGKYEFNEFDSKTFQWHFGKVFFFSYFFSRFC